MLGSLRERGRELATVILGRTPTHEHLRSRLVAGERAQYARARDAEQATVVLVVPFHA